MLLTELLIECCPHVKFMKLHEALIVFFVSSLGLNKKPQWMIIQRAPSRGLNKPLLHEASHGHHYFNPKKTEERKVFHQSFNLLNIHNTHWTRSSCKYLHKLPYLGVCIQIISAVKHHLFPYEAEVIWSKHTHPLIICPI